MTKHFAVEAMANGEIRVSTTLAAEETRHGALVRGLTAAEARDFAAALIAAADRVGR